MLVAVNLDESRFDYSDPMREEVRVGHKAES